MMVERNVSRAAQRLLLGQPAVSHAVARLREVFDDPLFVRSGGAMQPTPRAVELAGTVAAVLEEVRGRVLARTRFDPATDRGTVRLGVSDYAEVAVMGPVLLAMRREAPQMRVVMRPADPDTIGAMLESGAADLALGIVPEPSGHLRHETLFEDDCVCAFDPQACGLQPPLGLRDYLDLPHLLHATHGEPEGVTDPALREAGPSRFVYATTAHLLSIPWLLHGVRAVAVMPRRYAVHCARLTRLAVSDLPTGAVRCDMDMVWHPRTDQAEVQVWLRGLLRRMAAGSPGDPSSLAPLVMAG